MSNIENLRNLVDEFNRLCNAVEKDNAELEGKLQAANEEKYFWLCTELAPYQALAKDVGGRIEIALDSRIRMIFYTEGIEIWNRYFGRSFNISTICGDFIGYDDFKGYGEETTRDEMIKKWDSQKFEKDFTEALQKAIAMKASRLSEKNERLRKEINP